MTTTASRRACRFFVAWFVYCRRCHRQRWMRTLACPHAPVLPCCRAAVPPCRRAAVTPRSRHYMTPYATYHRETGTLSRQPTHPLFNVDSANRQTADVKKRQTLRSAVFHVRRVSGDMRRYETASLRTSDARRRCRPVGLRRTRLLAGPASQLASSARTRRCCCYAVLRTMRTRWCASTGCRCRQR